MSPSILISMPATPGVLGLGQGGLKVGISLQQRGWDVEMICAPLEAGFDPPFPCHVADVAKTMRVINRRPLNARLDWMLDAGYATFDRLAQHHVGSPDVVYAFSQAGLATLRRAQQAGALTMLHAANTYLPHLRKLLVSEYHALGLGAAPVSRRAVRRVLAEYALADAIRAQSSLVRDSLLEGGIPAEKLILVPPAVDLERFRPAASVPLRFTVAYVGEFSVRKGFHYLAKAWASSPRNADDRLLLHGGPGTRWARRLLDGLKADSRVELVAGDPAETYRNASVCVVPSIEDGYCYVALEAMASGVPVVLTDQVGARDLIDDGVNGYIVPSRDARALRDRLDTLRDRPALLTSMADAARRTAERYGFEAEGRALGDSLLAAVTARGALPARTAATTRADA